MTDGALVATFPDIIGQLEFVWIGSNGTGPAGTPYGDPARAGGQHKTLSYNGNPMPNFDKSLSQSELLAVIRYEWETLSGGKTTVDAAGNITYADGKPIPEEDRPIVELQCSPETRKKFNAFRIVHGDNMRKGLCGEAEVLKCKALVGVNGSNTFGYATFAAG